MTYAGPIPMSLYTNLRASPLWHPYLAATLRLRRCTDATPRLTRGARFNSVLAVEQALCRATHAGFSAIFDAAERETDEILRRYRRWAA
jgi:hypothetical protein